MKKYLAIFALSFKMQIIWRFDVAMTMVAAIAQIVAAWILWSAVFSEREIVSGFTFTSMLSYYIVVSFLGSINMSNQISGEVSYLIKNGQFSKHMVAPMNPFGFFGYTIAGEAAFHLAFGLIAVAICTVFMKISIFITPNTPQLILGGALALMGLLFMAGYHYLVGISAFKFVDIGFFIHMQGTIIAFATGSLVPLSLLPDAVVEVLKFLPFTHVLYTPAMLITGQMNIGEGIFAFAVMSIWTIIIIFAGQRIYEKFRIRYEGVGI